MFANILRVLHVNQIVLHVFNVIHVRTHVIYMQEEIDVKLAKLQGALAPGGPEEPASVPAAQEEPAAAPGEVIHWSAEAIPGAGPDAIAAVRARRAGKRQAVTRSCVR